MIRYRWHPAKNQFMGNALPMTSYEDLVKDAANRLEPESKIPREFPEEIRKTAARKLTGFLSKIRPFSFVRLGDMELGLMLEHQLGKTNQWTELGQNEAIDSSTTFGHPGLKADYIERLIRAYETATYVDFHERWWINRELNPLLQLHRAPGALRNEGEADSHIFMDWVRYELRDYMVGRRCLFAGAEAAVFDKLSRSPVFHSCSSEFINLSPDTRFLPLADKIGSDLDKLKSRISEIIAKDGIDTLFLSLGGGAKILCAELAAEHEICAFDFGGLMRGLTYSGSDGQMFCRSTHHPFFYKVPFDLYMDALEEAFPEYLPEQLLCKAQCQVFLEGASHQVGKSMPTPRFTISGDSRVAFEEAYRLYRRRYDHLANSSKRLKLIDLAFQMEVEKIQAGKSLNYWYVRVFKAALRRLTL